MKSNRFLETEPTSTSPCRRDKLSFDNAGVHIVGTGIRLEPVSFLLIAEPDRQGGK